MSESRLDCGWNLTEAEEAVPQQLPAPPHQRSIASELLHSCVVVTGDAFDSCCVHVGFQKELSHTGGLCNRWCW